MIKVSNLNKSYQSGALPIHVLKDISLSIDKGMFVAVMGRSGSGKTTLLRQLGLLDEPETGEIFIDGIDVSTLSDNDQTYFRLYNLGYIFQDYFLLPELTAWENVYLPLMANAITYEQDYKAIAKDVLVTVGLADKLESYPTELSGGQQQRVAVARAIAHKPKILFADEPCANLDSESSFMVMELLRKLNHETGQTILMVSHEDEDKDWVDQVIYLKDGRIERIEGKHTHTHTPKQ